MSFWRVWEHMLSLEVLAMRAVLARLGFPWQISQSYLGSASGRDLGVAPRTSFRCPRCVFLGVWIFSQDSLCFFYVFHSGRFRFSGLSMEVVPLEGRTSSPERVGGFRVVWARGEDKINWMESRRTHGITAYVAIFLKDLKDLTFCLKLSPCCRISPSINCNFWGNLSKANTWRAARGGGL